MIDPDDPRVDVSLDFEGRVLARRCALCGATLIGDGGKHFAALHPTYHGGTE